MSSCVPLFVTPLIIAHQAPLSMGLPRHNFLVSNLGKTQLDSSIFGVFHVVALRCYLGLISLKV